MAATVFRDAGLRENRSLLRPEQEAENAKEEKKASALPAAARCPAAKVIPAKAGIHLALDGASPWIPAFAGDDSGCLMRGRRGKPARVGAHLGATVGVVAP